MNERILASPEVDDADAIFITKHGQKLGQAELQLHGASVRDRI